MNDRFKFRVWDDVNNKYVNKGVLLRCGDLAIPSMKNDYDMNPVDGRYSVEQCTGLKDKNGKLIYENDVIKIGRYSMNWVIMVDDYGLRCICPKGNPILGCVEWSSVVKDYFFDEDNISVEIIGNIHENPELLKEEE